MNTIKIGIIGTGFSATSHLEALRRVPNVEVTAIVSRSLEKAKDLAGKYNIPHAYDDIEDLLQNDSIEAVHNCTPNSLHFSINKKLLEAGKHVLSEKPLALNSQESQELKELAERKNLVNGVCFNYRHYPLIREAKVQLAGQSHGKVHMVHGGYVQDWCLYPTDYSWRMDKNLNGASRAVADIGSHWCDTVQSILGKKIVRVFADLQTVYPQRKKSLGETTTFSTSQTENVDRGEKVERVAEAEEGAMEAVDIDTEDAAHVIVHFEDGISGVFTVSQVSAGRKNRLHFDIAASESTLSWDQELPNQLWIGKRDQPNQMLMKDPGLLSAESQSLAHYPGGHQEGWPDALKNLFLEFYDHVKSSMEAGAGAVTEADAGSGSHTAESAVDHGGKYSYATFEDGHYIMKIIDAILESNEKKQWVEII